MVESHYQSGKRLRRVSGPARFDWDFHVRYIFYLFLSLQYSFNSSRHSKIPTLKISLIQIFQAHLWQKSMLIFLVSMQTNNINATL